MSTASSVELKKLNTYAFAAGQRFVAVATTGTATYNENALQYVAAAYTGSVTGAQVVDGGTNNLLLTLGSGSSGSLSAATEPNPIAALGGLSRYTGLNLALLNLFNAGQVLNLGSTADGNRAGSWLNACQLAAK